MNKLSGAGTLETMLARLTEVCQCAKVTLPVLQALEPGLAEQKRKGVQSRIRKVGSLTIARNIRPNFG